MLTQLIKNENIHNVVWLFFSPFESLVVQQPELNMLCQSYLFHFPGVFFLEPVTTLVIILNIFACKFQNT